MSGFALEPVGLYGLEQINNTRLGPTAKPKKKIDPANIRGVIIRIPRSDYDNLVKQIESVLDPLGHRGHWVAGSAGSWHPTHRYYKMGSIKSTAGDIDVHIESKAIAKNLGLPASADDTDIRNSFAEYLKKYFESVTQSGEQVHIGIPTGNNVYVSELNREVPAYYQVDFPTTEYAATTVKHHEHEYAGDYKWDGQDQQLAISSLVNSIPGLPEKSHLYYGMGGALKHRGTGEVQERDIDKIAKIIFNDPNANQDWLSTVNRILDKIPNGINNPRLAQFKNDMVKKYPNRVLEGTTTWFRNMMNILS